MPTTALASGLLTGLDVFVGRPIVMITKQPFVESASHLLKGLHRVGSVRTIDFDEFLDKPGLLTEAILAATERQREAVDAGFVA
ncbi:hypothetical protein GCM10010232_38930 [Streptomyces amakusaensis]|uniref:Uncharacterized protein n=1 Tax=Streptomyces amakusaensis TaxID=67271 RepID=A0ABW0AQ88_9ACTN